MEACSHPSVDTAGYCSECGEQVPRGSLRPEGPSNPSADVGSSQGAAKEPGSRTGETEWRLVPKDKGEPLYDKAIPLKGSKLILGRFDDATGPVDVDLSQIPGAETISRNHAVLEHSEGRWLIADMRSTNGVYLRRNGEEVFSARIVEPTVVRAGDEIGLGMMVLQLIGSGSPPQAFADPVGRMAEEPRQDEDIEVGEEGAEDSGFSEVV